MINFKKRLGKSQLSSPSKYALLASAFCLSMSFSKHAAGQPDIRDIFQTTLACAVVEPLLADMPVTPVFSQEGGSCIGSVPDSSSQGYFTDSTCQTPLPFAATSMFEYCGLLLDADNLGEGDGIGRVPEWTLSPGSRLDVGARSLDGVIQPYLQRQIYRTIETPRGTCELEMRVYASSPVVDTEQTSPSLLALHGGSWSARGFGFFGLELSIPHYVNQGFVVYAPFYRLLGDSEGSAACNQAGIGDIVDDAEAALDWVQERAAQFGSSAQPVVFGQSAGAHLATSLLVNRADDVSGAVLLYPPTDFTDFALRAQQGFYADEQGLGILERLIGVEASLVDISASPVPENSFPTRIVQQAIDVAPVMMIHGMRDTLVEARQSIRLCDALSGRMLQAVDDELAAITALRETISCGESSEVQLIREGQHALDVCFADFIIATDLCPSGSEASRVEVSRAIAEAVLFAAQHADADVNDNGVGDNIDDGSGGIDQGGAQSDITSGGGALGFGSLIILLFYRALGWRWHLQLNTRGQ